MFEINLVTRFEEALGSLGLKKDFFLEILILEYSQVVRHRFLVPTCEGSIPSTPVSFQKG